MASTSRVTSPDRVPTLEETFAACSAEGRAALVVYTTAGHPDPDHALDTLLALSDAGSDVLELGIPFSDPLADGPVIQASSFRAIEHGVGLGFALELLRRFRRERATPVVVFSYLNPILGYGVDRFLGDAAAAGAQGVLLTDLPAGADPQLEDTVRASPLDLIRLVAPTTPPERVREIAQGAEGFLYYVSRTGVTGAQSALAEGLEEEVARVRASTSLPVAVGFGISSPEQARVVAGVADGVVVGSAVVDRLARDGVDAAADLVRGLRGALGRPAR